MDIGISIVVTLLLTIANGYFSASEMAVVNAKRAILEPEAEAGDKRAQRAVELAADSGQFLATIQVAITLVGFASSAFAVSKLATPFASVLKQLGCPFSELVSPALITLLVSYISIVIGELVPKRVALSKAESIAKSVAGPISLFMKLATPLVWLTSSLSGAIVSLLGIAEEDRQNVSEDEIRYLVEDADDLTDAEKSMIHDVIDLGDTVAREVMVPRVDMTAVEDSTTLHEVLQLMRETGYSRIPVFHEDIDHVVGIAHIKDIISPIVDEKRGADAIGVHIRKASFVPDTKDIFPLLSEMRAAREQMIIVVDEYGGTAGIITLEDIIEEVVGEIRDEFDPDNKYITALAHNEWLVDGRFPIDDARDLAWPIESSDEYETIAGFVLELADSLPRPGMSFEKDGYIFRVQTMRGKRIATIRVTAPEDYEAPNY